MRWRTAIWNNSEAAKIAALSSGKIDKCEYLTDKEISSSNQIQIIEQSNFTYFLLIKAFEKQTKKIEKQGKKTNRCFYKIKRKTSNFNQKSYLQRNIWWNSWRKICWNKRMV